jgi:hypothetical protein
MSLSIPIKYIFSDFHNINQYIFSLKINDNLTFKNIEHNKYSHLIKLDNNIILKNIKNYKVQMSIVSNNTINDYELEGEIEHNGKCFIHKNNNIFIEFTQNDNGYALCTCFYTGLDYNKLFVSPPN